MELRTGRLDRGSDCETLSFVALERRNSGVSGPSGMVHTARQDALVLRGADSFSAEHAGVDMRTLDALHNASFQPREWIQHMLKLHMPRKFVVFYLFDGAEQVFGTGWGAAATAADLVLGLPACSWPM